MTDLIQKHPCVLRAPPAVMGRCRRRVIIVHVIISFDQYVSFFVCFFFFASKKNTVRAMGEAHTQTAIMRSSHGRSTSTTDP